jgi:hypothetical protein
MYLAKNINEALVPERSGLLWILNFIQQYSQYYLSALPPLGDGGKNSSEVRAIIKSLQKNIWEYNSNWY